MSRRVRKSRFIITPPDRPPSNRRGGYSVTRREDIDVHFDGVVDVGSLHRSRGGGAARGDRVTISVESSVRFHDNAYGLDNTRLSVLA